MSRRVVELDGWRAVSIYCVLAGHMLPLGPKFLELNGAVATTGMAIFFTLSGYLIVNMLLHDDGVPAFLLRRFSRILPLAWLCLAIVLFLENASVYAWVANFFFFANFPPYYLDHAGHFWSLCVEMQFYIAIALVFAMFGRRGLLLVPAAALAITINRIIHHEAWSIITWFRVDEILAGGTLALLFHYGWMPLNGRFVRFAPYLLAPLLLLASHSISTPLAYMRPYLAAALVGVTMVASHAWLRSFLASRINRYVAEISYALYVVHPFTVYGWLGSGDTYTKYAKRPLCFLITFGIAHLSTFYYEKWWRDRAKEMLTKFRARSGARN